MTEELELVFEKLTFNFETRKFAELRILLLDMEPFDIATYMEENLDDKEQIILGEILMISKADPRNARVNASPLQPFLHAPDISAVSVQIQHFRIEMADF